MTQDDDDPGMLRNPPHNFEAEMMVLALALSSPAALDVMRPIIADPKRFADDRHGVIWTAICNMADQGTRANPITLKTWAENAGCLAELGGPPYLAKLAATAVTAISAREYARVVSDAWRARELITVCNEAIDRAYAFNPAQRVDDIGAELAGKMDVIFAEVEDARMVTVGEGMKSVIARADLAHKGELPLISTGFPPLDAMLGQLERGAVYVIGGRPGMGKTGLGIWMAHAAARAQHAVLYVSLEMTTEAICRRIAAGLCNIDLKSISTGTLLQHEWSRLIEAESTLGALPFVVDDRPALSLAQIKAKARHVARRAKRGLGVMVVDHLGLIAPPPELVRHGLTATVEHASNGLKRLAKELDCAVIVLTQLNRGPEGREDKRPNLADLRQSGAIEQDADAVMFLYRRAYYEQRKPPEREPGETIDAFNARKDGWRNELQAIINDAEVIIAKQRDGEIGTVDLHFKQETARFTTPAIV